MELLHNFLNHSFLDIKLRWKHEIKAVNNSLIIYGIINAVKSYLRWIIYRFFRLDKKATINSVNDGDISFQYAAIVVLNYEEICKEYKK